MSGRRRNSGTLPGSRRFTFESRTFSKFWPDTESFESRGERSRKDSVYRDYTNFTGAGEPGRFICLAQCLRTSGGRSQRSGSWKISWPLPPLSGLTLMSCWPFGFRPCHAQLLTLRFPMKRKMIVDCGLVEVNSTVPQIHNNRASTFPVLLLDELFYELPDKSEVPAFAILSTDFLIDLIYIISPISHI